MNRAQSLLVSVDGIPHSLRCHRIGWVIQTLILSLGAAYGNMKSMTINIFFCFYRENLIDKRIEGAVSRMQSVIELGRVIRDRKTLPVKVNYHFDPIHFCNPLGSTLYLLYRKHEFKTWFKMWQEESLLNGHVLHFSRTFMHILHCLSVDSSIAFLWCDWKLMKRALSDKMLDLIWKAPLELPKTEMHSEKQKETQFKHRLNQMWCNMDHVWLRCWIISWVTAILCLFCLVVVFFIYFG